MQIQFKLAYIRRRASPFLQSGAFPGLKERFFRGNAHSQAWKIVLSTGTQGPGLQYSSLVLLRLAIADKPVRRVYRSVKVIKHSTIPYVRYSFLLCNSNVVFKTSTLSKVTKSGSFLEVFTIFDFKKYRDLEIGVKGHSRSLKVAQFDRLCMVSY